MIQYIPSGKRNLSNFNQMHKLTNGIANDNELSNDIKKAKMESHYPPSKVVHIRNLPYENELEIVQLGAPFGKVSNILVLKNKNQAFLELGDIHSAIAMVDYYEKNTVNLHNKRIYVQYSNHQELKTPASSQYLEIFNQSQILNLNEKPPTSVLKITVENLIYPLNVDIMLQIFVPFGNVVKIVTFNKNNKFYALIQYSDILMAQKAKNSLNGQNIYNGCNTLNIEYSDLTNLQIKAFDDVTSPKVMTNSVEHNNLPHVLNNLGNNGNIPVNSMPLSAINPFSSPLNLNNVLPNHHHAMNSSHSANLTVLLVSNLNEEKITPYSLFILFGVYGDVMRVKIMYNKKSNALIQMGDTNQLNLAIQNLNKRSLYGKIISVVPSKIQNIQMPKDETESDLTKDYSVSPLHRFKKPGSKNFQNIAPPSCNLHISNIPLNSTEDSIVKLFSQNGRKVLNFRFFPRDQKMALIQMSNEEEAMDSLIALHNHKIGDTYLRVSFSKISL